MALLSPNKTASQTNQPHQRKNVTGRFVLGIDVGTTSVKVCLVNIDTGEVSHKFVKVGLKDICARKITLHATEIGI